MFSFEDRNGTSKHVFGYLYLPFLSFGSSGSIPYWIKKGYFQSSNSHFVNRYSNRTSIPQELHKCLAVVGLILLSKTVLYLWVHRQTVSWKLLTMLVHRLEPSSPPFLQSLLRNIPFPLSSSDLPSPLAFFRYYSRQTY